MTKTLTAALTSFLLERIDEDEAVARAGSVDPDAEGIEFFQQTYLHEKQPHASLCGWRLGEGLARECECHYPTRALARCAADRIIVEAHELSPYYGLDRHGRWLPREGAPKFWYCDCESDDGMIGRDGPCATLRALASAYADHPDYRADEWA